MPYSYGSSTFYIYPVIALGSVHSFCYRTTVRLFGSLYVDVDGGNSDLRYDGPGVRFKAAEDILPGCIW